MKNILILFFALVLSLPSLAQADFSMTVLAGSNAPWGKTQYLHIDGKGNAHYTLSSVEKNILDSSRFTISKAELKQLSEAIARARFFSLKELYTEDMDDGIKLQMAVTSNKRTHSVTLLNAENSEMTGLLGKLNTILKAYKIQINY